MIGQLSNIGNELNQLPGVNLTEEYNYNLADVLKY